MLSIKVAQTNRGHEIRVAGSHIDKVDENVEILFRRILAVSQPAMVSFLFMENCKIRLEEILTSYQ